jgi:hypothetical protein
MTSISRGCASKIISLPLARGVHQRRMHSGRGRTERMQSVRGAADASGAQAFLPTEAGAGLAPVRPKMRSKLSRNEKNTSTA